MKRRLKRIYRIIGHIYIILKGYKIYERLLEQYGADCHIMVGQHPGTGDVYLQSSFLNSYAKKKGIQNYVFTVVGGGAKAVAALFDLKNIHILTTEETNCLVEFYRFAGEVCNIKILHYHPMMLYYGSLGYVRNYKGLNFYEMLIHFVFEDLDEDAMELPRYECDQEYLDTLFTEKKLERGRTVLIAPYANSLAELPMQFWEQLVSQLNKKGYTVCTNSAGSAQPPVRGSCPVYIPYRALRAFVEQAGYSISFRSGLSDILSSINHTQIVIHPKQDIYSIMGGLGSSFEYFSIKDMGLHNDAIEYEVAADNEKKMKHVLKSVLCHFDAHENLLENMKMCEGNYTDVDKVGDYGEMEESCMYRVPSCRYCAVQCRNVRDWKQSEHTEDEWLL